MSQDPLGLGTLFVLVSDRVCVIGPPQWDTIVRLVVNFFFFLKADYAYSG